MKILIIMPFLFFFCISCIKQDSQLQIADNRFFSSLVLEVCKEHELRAYEYGEWVIKSENSLEFGFDSKRKLNLDEARKFYFNINDSLVAKIIRDQNHLSCLNPSFFEQKKIHLSISFVKDAFSNLNVEPPYIAFVHGDDKIIHYDIVDKANEYQSFHSESVKRARGILEHQNQSLNICEPSTQ